MLQRTWVASNQIFSTYTAFYNNTKKKSTSLHPPQVASASAYEMWLLQPFTWMPEATLEGGLDQAVSISAFPNPDKAQLISELTSKIIVSYKYANVNHRGGTISPWRKRTIHRISGFFKGNHELFLVLEPVARLLSMSTITITTWPNLVKAWWDLS